MGGSMTRTFFALAIIVVPLATALVTVQTSRAEPAVDECKTKPDSSAPAGSHWYYRANRADQRHCWYLGPEGAKVRSQAREGASHVSRPTRTAAGEDPPRDTSSNASANGTRTKDHGGERTRRSGERSCCVPAQSRESSCFDHAGARDHEQSRYGGPSGDRGA